MRASARFRTVSRPRRRLESFSASEKLWDVSDIVIRSENRGLLNARFAPKTMNCSVAFEMSRRGQFTTPAEPSLGTNEMIKNCNRYCLCTIYGTQLSRSGLDMRVHGALGNV
jgi:hypothetical protein